MKGEEILLGESPGEGSCQLWARYGTIPLALAAALRACLNQTTVDDCGEKGILGIEHNVENAFDKIAISIPLFRQKDSHCVHEFRY